MQVDILQGGFSCAGGTIGEGHMVEVDGAVLHLGDGLPGVGQVRFLIQHFADAAPGSH